VVTEYEKNRAIDAQATEREVTNPRTSDVEVHAREVCICVSGQFRSKMLQLLIRVVGQQGSVGLLQLCVVLRHKLLVDIHLRWFDSRCLDEMCSSVARKLADDVEERLLEVVVALGRDIVVLQVLLAMEKDIFRLDTAFSAVHLVSTQDDGDVLAHAYEILVPDRHVLVCNTRGDVEHDDRSLTANVVTVSETAEFLLTGGIPAVETDTAKVGRKGEGRYFYTHGCNIFSSRIHPCGDA